MPEATRHRPAVVRCLASPPALAALPGPPGAAVVRVAPDELLLVGDTGDAPALTATALAALAADPDALVVDVSDAWTAVGLLGAGAEETFRRLSPLPLPPERPAALQGSVAGLAAKVLVGERRIDVLVSSAAGDFLWERVHA